MGIEKYFQREFNDESKTEIIKSILDEVNSKDSARVGYHAEQSLKRDRYKVAINILSKIEAKIIQDKRYKSRPYPNVTGDYEIYKNPDYKNEAWHELKRGIITVAVTLVAGILLWWLTEHRDSKQLEDRIEKVEQILNDSIKIH